MEEESLEAMSVISVRQLSKIYHLYNSEIDRLKEALHPRRKKYHRDFYALKNVSFDVKKGEVLGIVGKNGSGKSTLLKILAGALTPSSGTVNIGGKVALLQLGAGFNPDFSGLENIYFSSAVMGYSKEETDEQIDEILAFADIGDFINQPVKTYSSGMFARLAFAVASNIEPDILIVDEALAVGDDAFKRKCHAKIASIQERGVTTIFVSHSAGIVIELCHRALLLDQGELILAAHPKTVVARYHQFLYAEGTKMTQLREKIKREFRERSEKIPAESSEPKESPRPRPLPKEAVEKQEFYDPNFLPQTTTRYSEDNQCDIEIHQPELLTPGGKQVNQLIRGREYIYRYKVSFSKQGSQIRFGMMIKTVSGFEIAGAASSSLKERIPSIPGDSTVEVEFRFKCLLRPGVYFMNAGVKSFVDGKDVFLDRIIDALMFRVQHDKDMFETGLVSFLIEPSYTILAEDDEQQEDDF